MNTFKKFYFLILLLLQSLTVLGNTNGFIVFYNREYKIICDVCDYHSKKEFEDELKITNFTGNVTITGQHSSFSIEFKIHEGKNKYGTSGNYRVWTKILNNWNLAYGVNEDDNYHGLTFEYKDKSRALIFIFKRIYKLNNTTKEWEIINTKIMEEEILKWFETNN